MQLDKRLRQTVQGLVRTSVDDKGSIRDKAVEAHLKYLIQLPRGKSLTALTEYLKGIKRELKKSTLFLEAATPLSPEQETKIVEHFKKFYPVSGVKANLNPLLLGGIKIKISDWVYDDSISMKINQLKGESYG